MDIPNCELAFIGGSSSLSIEVPEELNLDYIQVLDKKMVFSTPYGSSPEFKFLNIQGEQGDRKILSCRMHGWRTGVSRADASRQIFWVFLQAGVKGVLAEGGVGAINHLLKPRDIVVPHDYIDFSVRKDVGLGDRYLLVMREALCGVMRKKLQELLDKTWEHRVFDRGVYVNTDGRHFESPAEVALFKTAGADIVGQSICPEVYLAREIGACYAGLYLVVNYAEGIVAPWAHKELAEIFHGESLSLARVVFEFFKTLPLERECDCANLRKETLLKEVYK